MNKRFLSMVLVLCMVVTMLPVTVMAEGTYSAIDSKEEIIAFEPLQETEKFLEVGTALEDLNLPETLAATVRRTFDMDINPDTDQQTVTEKVYDFEYEDNFVDIEVLWISQPEYDMNTEGEYVFTPVIEGYTVSAELPEVTVTVGAAVPRGIMFGPMAINVAKIGTTEYTTLQMAVNAVSSGQTIELLGDIVLSDSIVIQSDNNISFTLDLKGKILDSGSNTAIQHNGTGTLTITDTDAGGRVTSSANISPTTTINLNGGNLVVESGTIENTWSNISANAILKDHGIYGTVEVIGGTIIATDGTAIYYGYLPTPSDPTIPRGILVSSGTPIIKGGYRAMNITPDLSSYDNVKVTASRNYDGSSPEDYSPEQSYIYRYLKFESDATVGNGGNYELSETGLKAAISAARDGDTIRFISGGTVKLTQDIHINKSITLDLNNHVIDFDGRGSIESSFNGVDISEGASVIIQGPGGITTDNNVFVHLDTTLIVQGDVVIEGTGDWQTLINYGTVFMIGGALQHRNGKFILQNSGTATFNSAMLQSRCEREPVVSNLGTLILNDSAVINTFSGAGSWQYASVVSAHNSAAVTLNGGTLTAPEDSTASAVYIAINATFTNNGATITNGYVKNLEDLTVDVSSGSNKVTLKAQTPEIGVTYYYKTTVTDGTVDKPTLDGSAAFVLAGWTAFSGDTDIPRTSAATVYVQVVKVGNSEQKIYGWGQDSADPMVTSHTITYSANGGSGSMTADTATEGVAFNLSQNGFTAPKDKQFKAWAIGSTSGTQVNAEESHMFTEDTTVYALWEDVPIVTHTIIATAGAGGNISPSGNVIVNNGEHQTFTIMPSRNYSIADVKVDNISKGRITSYTFSSVKADHNISVTFNYNGSSDSSSEGSTDSSSSSSNRSTVIVTPPTPNNPSSPTQGEIKIPGTVDSRGNVTATITSRTIIDAFDEALANAKKNGNEENGITVVLRVDTGRTTGSNLTVNLPKAVQDAIVARKILSTIVVVDNPDITIGMDLATVEEINNQARSDVNITATPMDKDELTEDGKEAIGNRPVFDLKMSYGRGQLVEDFGTGSVSVTIPYTLDENEKAENVQAVYVDGNGKVHWLENSAYDSEERVLRFSTHHFSTYGVGYRENGRELTDVEINSELTDVGFNTAFTDITDHWAKDDIAFVVNRGLFGGTSATTFSPNTAMTRGMFVTVMGRLANVDAEDYKESSFTDVKGDAYYMGYIEWASKNNIVNGVGNKQFAPEQSITREEIAVIMSNYAKTMGYTMPKIYGENTFVDDAKISTYAKEAVQQMQRTGIISGKGDNLLDPQGTATRAEVSAVLRRFVELMLFSDTVL